MTRPPPRLAPLLQSRRNRLSAGIVESHSVHDRLFRNRAEQPRWWIAGLRVPGHRAEFGKAKAQRFPGGHGGGLLVQAGGQTDWIRKSQPETFYRQLWRCKERPQRITSQFAAARRRQQAQRAIVDLLGLLGEQDWSDEPAINQFIPLPRNILSAPKR